MKTTRVGFAFAFAVLACGPVESPVDRALDDQDAPTTTATEAAVAPAPEGMRHVRLLERIAAQDLRRAGVARVAVLEGGTPVGPRAQACLDNCGGAPWCDALCETEEEEIGGAPAFAEAQRPPADCPACGRETGFLPSPPTVEATREGQVVAVDWTEVTGAEQYELLVLRQKDGFGEYERFDDQTTVETEARVSMLPAGFVYVFAVTPYLEGDLAVQLTGVSSPLSL